MTTNASPNVKPKIVYLVPGGPSVHELMRQVIPRELKLVCPDTKDRKQVDHALSDATFVITVKMDAALMAAAPGLRLIQLAGVGFDGVDLAAASARGIPVCQTVVGTIPGVAEHTLLLMLALYRRLFEADASVRRGEWRVWQLRHESHTLVDKNVGILGLGRIGREVALRCRAFGARITYHDPIRAPADVEAALGATYLTKDELLASADVVSLHLPLSAATRNVFGAAELGRMKRTAIVVNTGRGGLIDEEALAVALEEGRLAGAGLDVFANEPPEPTSRLLRAPNTVLTPHIATGTRESVLAKTRAACENFLRVLAGQAPTEVVNQAVNQSEKKAVTR
jgi:phosphoglycerate dehydrogenase-like enzyme